MCDISEYEEGLQAACETKARSSAGACPSYPGFQCLDMTSDGSLLSQSTFHTDIHLNHTSLPLCSSPPVLGHRDEHRPMCPQCQTWNAESSALIPGSHAAMLEVKSWFTVLTSEPFFPSCASTFCLTFALQGLPVLTYTAEA